MAAKMYYEADCDPSIIRGRKVAIIGYGSQGHAHALNLKDSGGKVTVGLRRDGASWDKAKKAGLQVKEVGEAIKGADFVMMLMPDERLAALDTDYDDSTCTLTIKRQGRVVARGRIDTQTGRTLIDRWDRTGAPHNALLLETLDAGGFFALLGERLASLP